MARQVGPQERKPEHSRVHEEHVAEMRTFLAYSIRARRLRSARQGRI